MSHWYELNFKWTSTDGSTCFEICLWFLLLFNLLCLFIGSTPTHTPSSNSTDRERDRNSAGRKRLSATKFQPPDQPPARKDWVPDTQQHVCMVCRRERFTMVSGPNGVKLPVLSYIEKKYLSTLNIYIIRKSPNQISNWYRFFNMLLWCYLFF